MPVSRNTEYYDTVNRFNGTITEENEPDGRAKFAGFGIAERQHIRGLKVCVSGRGCKLGDGRKKLAGDGTCGLCGGRLKR